MTIHMFVTASVLLFIARSAIADELFELGPTIQESVQLIERHHFAQRPLNDDLSRRWLRSFVARLDPRKLYFLDADLQEFRTFEDQLDDQSRAGDTQFPELVRKRFQARVKVAVAMATEYLAAKHDFSINEECPLEFESFAANDQALRERWRLSLKAELLVEKVHGRMLEDVHAQLAGRCKRILKQADDMTDERLCQHYLDSLLELFDPHSSYISPTLIASFNETISIIRHSLGLGLRQRKGRFEITSVPWAQRPADLERMVNWSLIAIGRIEGDTIDVTEMHYDDLLDLIWWADGPLESDTDVILELMHPVTRERVTMSWIRPAR